MLLRNLDCRVESYSEIKALATSKKNKLQFSGKRGFPFL